MNEQILHSYLNENRVIVAGGRDFNDYEYMRSKLNELIIDNITFGGRVKIISGMANGADITRRKHYDKETAKTLGVCYE